MMHLFLVVSISCVRSGTTQPCAAKPWTAKPLTTLTLTTAQFNRSFIHCATVNREQTLCIRSAWSGWGPSLPAHCRFICYYIYRCMYLFWWRYEQRSDWRLRGPMIGTCGHICVAFVEPSEISKCWHWTIFYMFQHFPPPQILIWI